MNRQWYRSSLVKGVLIVLEHVLIVTIAVGFLWIMSYPMLRTEALAGRTAEKYEDTVSFEKNLQSLSYDVIDGIRTRELIETDGAYVPERIVDIREFYENSRITDEDVNGLSYTLEELEIWGESWDINGSNTYNTGGDPDDNIIVCKRSDHTFHYYYYSEFKKLIDNGELRFVIATDESGISEENILSNLKDGSLYNTSETSYKGLQDAEGRVVYIDCWSYDGYWFEEMCQPLGAGSIMEVANDNPVWNGRLSDAYAQLRDVIYRIRDAIDRYENLSQAYQEGDTNVTYLYVNTKSGEVFTNRKEFREYEQIEKNLDKLRNLGKYVIVKPDLQDIETNIEDINALSWHDSAEYASGERENYIFALGVDTSYPVEDRFYSEAMLYEKYGVNIRKVALLGVVLSIVFLGILVWLTVTAGRNDKDEELHLNVFDRWKTELAASVVMGVWIVPTIVAGTCIDINSRQVSSYDTIYNYIRDIMPGTLIWVGIIAAYTCMMFLAGYMSLVRRIKAKTLWRNSILKATLVFLKQLFLNLHAVWKTILIFGGFVIVHWMGIISNRNLFELFLLLMVELVVFVYMMKQAIGRQRINVGVDKIAGGEVDYKIPTDDMGEEQRSIAEKINSIGQGLDTALAESIKSERLKTDLITNVSHDIKTPLTSIINYVNLLKAENFESPKIQRYLEVLEAKSQRLKILTEDVVEASKISSGNITLEFMNINLVEMIQQTSGEFEEKFKERNLTEVMTLPEQEVVISVDGRRLWRVLANIYNNTAKYAMEGTRVYADLYTSGTTAVFSLKNISEQPLNISADELTERFIRGDISRSTEGSGLGLSIAKTLTEMQGGKFELYLDGDLFRVTITFPIARKNEKTLDNREYS